MTKDAPSKAAWRCGAAAMTSTMFPPGATQLCTAGYVHGLAEGYLHDAAADADVAAVFPELCADEGARAGCAHGIGHALLRARDAAPATASDAALDQCGDLPDAWTLAGSAVIIASGIYLLHRERVTAGQRSRGL